MNKGLLVVDVQPAYSDSCDFIAPRVAQRINNSRKPVVILWVGEGLTSDCEDSVRDYLRRHGARPGQLAKATFVEKDYNFFRGWMDLGVAQSDIIKVGKELMRQGLSTSEELDLDELYEGDVPSFPEWDRLLLPTFESRRLLSFDAFDTCGGGADQCLAEIELWLQMHDRRFERVPGMVYS